MPPSRDTTVTLGIEGTDVRITVFIESRRVKTASLEYVVDVVQSGEPRAIGHALTVQVTDQPNPNYAGAKRAAPDYVIAGDGSIAPSSQ